jgi:hypothetical protein
VVVASSLRKSNCFSGVCKKLTGCEKYCSKECQAEVCPRPKQKCKRAQMEARKTAENLPPKNEGA